MTDFYYAFSDSNASLTLSYIKCTQVNAVWTRLTLWQKLTRDSHLIMRWVEIYADIYRYRPKYRNNILRLRSDVSVLLA